MISRFRQTWMALLLATLLPAGSLWAQTRSVRGGESVSVLLGDETTSQRAVFAAFLANLPDLDTALSISNTTAFVPGATLFFERSSFDGIFEIDSLGSVPQAGTIEIFLWDRDGTLIVYETGPGSPGQGLNPDGTLGPGRTWTVLLEEILEFATGEKNRSFVGYGWFVANFNGVAGTYNVTIFNVGFTQNFNLEPAMGSGLFFGGIPIKTP